VTIAQINAALAPADQALASAHRNYLDADGARDYGAGVVSARRAVADVLAGASTLYGVMPYVDNPGQVDADFTAAFAVIHSEKAKTDAIARDCALYQGGPMDALCFLQKAVKTSSAPISNMMAALTQAIAAARPAPSPLLTQLPHAHGPTSSAPLPGWKHRVSIGETPMKIAQKYGGHMSDLVAANPHKPLTNVSGVTTFVSLTHGESLNLPSHWTAG
jgi:hypothetical protein